MLHLKKLRGFCYLYVDVLDDFLVHGRLLQITAKQVEAFRRVRQAQSAHHQGRRCIHRIGIHIAGNVVTV